MSRTRQIAHELSNHITVIRGYGELVRRRIDPCDPAYREVQAIVVAADAARMLVHELSARSRGRRRRAA